MRSTHSVRSIVIAAVAALAVGCSSAQSTDSGAEGDTGGSTAATQPSNATEPGAAPDASGAWPPADACTLISVGETESLTGQTLSFAPVANSGESSYGPYCEYTSDASGLFMVVSTYSPDDLASFTEGWIDEARATAISGLGDVALLEVVPGINDSRVYVTSGDRAFSVQINSFSDNGWTPEITTEIATAVATALLT